MKNPELFMQSLSLIYFHAAPFVMCFDRIKNTPTTLPLRYALPFACLSLCATAKLAAPKTKE